MSAQRDSYRVDESKPWFSSEAGWPDKVPKNVDFPKITLYEMLSRSAKARPDLPAIWFLNSFMSYGELLRHVDAFAAGIHQLGLRKGDVVALALPSCFQYVISYYACAKLGLIAAGVNPTYKPGEVLHELKLTGAKTLIVLDALYSLLVTPIAAQHPLEPVVVTSIVDMVKVSSFKKWLGKKLKKIPTGPVPDQAVRFLELLKTPSTSMKVEVSPEDVATYVMTGSTTGVPKAAVLSHFNCVANALQVSLWMWIKEPGACMVGILPLFHAFGMSAVMVPTDLAREYDVVAMVRVAVERYGGLTPLVNNAAPTAHGARPSRS